MLAMRSNLLKRKRAQMLPKNSLKTEVAEVCKIRSLTRINKFFMLLSFGYLSLL